MARLLGVHLEDRFYREIAAPVRGAEAVADWPPGDALRCRVHRRLASARALLKRGYLGLLPSG